ncbi:MAG: MarR family transcriptional regulator [Gemmatimonadota bacterium]
MSRETRTVAEEIGQRRPFSSPVQELVVTLLRTTDEVRRLLADLMEPVGVTPQQYNVLRILRGAGEAGLPTLEIGRRMLERQPGVTRLVDRLVAKNLVDRGRDPEDRRRVLCTIRAEGRALLEAADKRLESVDRVVAGGLDADDLSVLVHLLDRLRATVGVWEPPQGEGSDA